MPEMIEVEMYRRAADRAVGRRIAAVTAPDAWFLKHGTTTSSLRALVGATVTGTRRVGKLLLVDTDGPVLGLRFGMTGRLLVDGHAPIERLEHSSARVDPSWIRFALGLDDGGQVVLVDPRRLGGVELDPDTERLGVDASRITAAALGAGLARSRSPLKAWLLDQQHVAGLGNLLVDEILWRASLDPVRPSDDLTYAEVRRLHRHLRTTIDALSERGGSHTGDLQVARVRGGSCPRDGAPLERRTVGGRTTYSCPHHQR